MTKQKNSEEQDAANLQQEAEALAVKEQNLKDAKQREKEDHLKTLNLTDETPEKEKKIIEKAAMEEGLEIPVTARLARGDTIKQETVASINQKWDKIPVDCYWFTKSRGRSPNPDEEAVWELELVTIDFNNQQSRLTLKVDGKYLEALELARARWAEDLTNSILVRNGVKPSKIMVLST